MLTFRRKSRQVEAALEELGMEGLEERLSSATQNPASPAYKLSRLVAEVTQRQASADTLVHLTPSLMCHGRMQQRAVGFNSSTEEKAQHIIWQTQHIY